MGMHAYTMRVHEMRCVSCLPWESAEKPEQQSNQSSELQKLRKAETREVP
jgi:hypothetical protein